MKGDLSKMKNITRLFVEKKEGFNVEAKSICADIIENINIKTLENMRILNRYDIEGLSENYYQAVKNTIFSEPPVDLVYEEEIHISHDEIIFAVEYLPGQYDQRADSAMQCIQIITQKEPPIVSVAKVFICKGNLSEEDIHKIKNYCINPVDSREAKIEKPLTLQIETENPENIKLVDGFIERTEEEIYCLRDTLELAMSGADLFFCQQYFKNTEKRNPTKTELRVIDTYWSDHCRHTTFLTNIDTIEFEDGFYKPVFEKAYQMYLEERRNVYHGKEKDICLMDIAVMGMKALRKKGLLDNLDESEEINACSIVVDVDVDGKNEEWLVMFKNETHNHPTEIEPFGGAATCLGGAIRDPLSGRSYVYQAMRVTGSGDPRTLVSETMVGKLPQRKITTGAAAGYSSYGNQIGLATGFVNEIYDEGYVAKRMEIGAVIGAVKRSSVKRERPIAGDVIILVGGRTGRDGCGGATGSSKEHTEDSILVCGAEVQKGNAPVERKLQRLFRNHEASSMIKRCNDFGAGGVSVAIGELAEGLMIELDKVPKKYDGLDGTELAISESQERMAVVVSKEDGEKFIKLANDENLEATIVAEVTDKKRLVMNWRDTTIVDISREFLDTNGVKQHADVFVTMPEKLFCKKEATENIKDKWLTNLKKLNVASQKGLVERFDSTIGAGSVLMPFGGKYQLTPEDVMAAKIPVLSGQTTTATLMSYGYNPEISKWSTFHGAMLAVVESVSKIVAAGGDYKSVRLTFQEYFERLGKDKEKWGKPFNALMGAFYAQMELGIPAIGGKDSMSGTFKDLTVPPTLVSFAVDVAKTNHIISSEFKKLHSNIVFVEAKVDELNIPDFTELRNLYETITKNIRNKNIISARSVTFGGISATISKMCFGNKIGFELKECDIDLFSEKYGAFVLEMSENVDIETLFHGLNYCILGKTNPDSIKIQSIEISLEEAISAWTSTLEKIFPTNIKKSFAEDINIKPFSVEGKIILNKGIAKPRVFVPVFFGTNCEYDTKKAFEEAGAEVKTFVIRNLKNNWLLEDLKAMEAEINQSQMIALPGGFSAGDEPDGSGKFIAAVFRNPYIKEAVHHLIKNRDGLMIGICNGFQALIKLGLVPYGEIRDLTEESPTLTFNAIGRHISCLAKTKIISNKSPWLWGVNPLDTHIIPVSHGEGRFVASEEIVKNLIANNQIATQYVNEAGVATYDINDNPNTSFYAIEGITSPDGRILGKMGHSERIGKDLYKNIEGQKDQKIFESGVKYFS